MDITTSDWGGRLYAGLYSYAESTPKEQIDITIELKIPEEGEQKAQNCENACYNN